MKGITSTNNRWFRACLIVALAVLQIVPLLCHPTVLLAVQADSSSASSPLPPRFGPLKRRLVDNPKTGKNNFINRRGLGPRLQTAKNASSAVAAANDGSKKNSNTNMFRITRSAPAATVLVALWTAFICVYYKPNPSLATPSKLNAVAGLWFNLQSAFWSYCHICSLLVITTCLVAERCLIQTEMSVRDEDRVVNIDLIFGLAGIALVGSGFCRAIHYGQGGDYYIHDVAFWIKMTLAGIWGGVTMFPSLIFYRRKQERHDIMIAKSMNSRTTNGIGRLWSRQQQQQQKQAPISPTLAQALHQIVHVELAAILFIPILGSFMRRGVLYSPNLVTRPIIGIVASITLMIASNLFYARKAWTWQEPAAKV